MSAFSTTYSGCYSTSLTGCSFAGYSFGGYSLVSLFLFFFFFFFSYSYVPSAFSP
jgi:hypothetical protein